MRKQSKRTLVGYLPLALFATFLVVGVPLLLVAWLRSSGVVTSVWAGMAIGVAVSLLASYAGGAFWKTRTYSRDILFSDLMLWGWVQRWRGEHRLTAAADVLGLTTGRPQAVSGGHLTNEQKAGLLTQLTSGLEAQDAYTHGHSRRVARYASNIAKRMGMSREEVAKIRAAGAMHDVGKVETPITVLHKDGKLTDGEYAIIKRHPVDGAAMVSTLRDDQLTAMVRHHHERLDGSGYPDRLAGEAIPIGARILAVADTFDAITSTRPYRHAHAHKKALDILATEAGTQLDPEAVRAFCSCYSGRRPLTYWTILVNLRPRLASWVGGGLAPAKAATAANVMATAATATAFGGALLGPAADADVSPSSSKPRSHSQATRHAPEASKPTRAQNPGRRPVRDSGQEKARSGHDPNRARPQNTAWAQNAAQAQNNSPPQGRGPTQDIAQPRDYAQAPDKPRKQGHGQVRDKPGKGKGKGEGKRHGHGQAPHKPRKQGNGRGREVRFTPDNPPHGDVFGPPSPGAGGPRKPFEWTPPADADRPPKNPKRPERR